MNPTLGIDHLKSLLVFASCLHDGIKASLNDRKVDVLDIVNLLPAFQALSPVIQGIELIVPEFKDLDSSEVDQLITLAKQLDPALASDVVAMSRIKASLDLAVSILNTIKAFKA